MSPERRATITFWSDLLLRFLLGLAVIWALVQFTLFITDVRRDLQQSQVKHDALLRDHQRLMDRLSQR